MGQRLPHTHVSRYTALHRSAKRKGYDLRENTDGSYRLVTSATGADSSAGSSLTLDGIATYLMAQAVT